MPMRPEVLQAVITKEPYENVGRENGFRYSLWIDNQGAGALNVFPNRGETWNVGLCYVADGYRRQGVGSRLTQAFVSDVGPGVRLWGDITNRETIAKLRELGYVQAIDRISAFARVESQDYPLLPVAVLMMRGGIDIREITVRREPMLVVAGYQTPSVEFGGVTTPVEAVKIIPTDKSRGRLAD